MESDSSTPSQPSEDASQTGPLESFRIGDISFQGARRTKPSVLAKIVGELFSVKTLSDFQERAIRVKDKLNSLDAFSDINIEVDLIEDGRDENFRVTFVVQEKGRIRGKTQVTVDNQSSAKPSLELGMPNLSGIGDSITLSSYYSKNLYSGECRYSVPITPWRKFWNPTYSLTYSQYEWDHLSSGLDQQDRSIINQVNFVSMPNLRHSISLENVWRYIKSSSMGTPIDIRGQCGHSLKTSLKHVVTWDNRSDNFPHQGTLAKLITEMAKIDGDTFSRHEAHLQLNTQISPGLLLQCNILAGTLLGAQKFNICDKFFLGGPLNIRGSRHQCVGPSIRNYPLGASSFALAGVHLYPKLPYISSKSSVHTIIRPHIFYNIGTIGEISDLWRVNSRDGLVREALIFRDSLRHSCGFGLVMCWGDFRFETNYCIPLRFKSGDSYSRGYQYGFGLSYK